MEIVKPKNQLRPKVQINTLKAGEVFETSATWIVCKVPSYMKVETEHVNRKCAIVVNLGTGELSVVDYDFDNFDRPDIVITTRDNCKTV